MKRSDKNVNIPYMTEEIKLMNLLMLLRNLNCIKPLVMIKYSPTVRMYFMKIWFFSYPHRIRHAQVRNKIYPRTSIYFDRILSKLAFLII